jgi:hypothetical protein
LYPCRSSRPRAASQTHNREQRRDKRVKVSEGQYSEVACQRLPDGDVGDSRYTREVFRTLLAEAKIYRVGKGGQCDPFRYVAAEFYDGAGKLPEGFVKHFGLERKLLRVATRIKDLVCEARDRLTEKEIRSVVGDNVGTGKALRSLVSQGHVKRMGRGGSGDPYVYEVVSGFESVPAAGVKKRISSIPHLFLADRSDSTRSHLRLQGAGRHPH